VRGLDRSVDGELAWLRAGERTTEPGDRYARGLSPMKFESAGLR